MGQSVSNKFVSGAVVDINRPLRVPYDPRQHEYPKMLFHQKRKDPNWEREHKRITLYNSLHPEKPEILPVVPYEFIKVNNKQEEDQRLKEGYGLRAPLTPDAEVEEFEVPHHPASKASKPQSRV